MTAVAHGIGAISQAQVHAGTPAVRSAIDDVLSRVQHSAHVDVFRVDDGAVMDSLVSLAKRDVGLSVLADTDASTGALARDLRRAASDGDWHELGGDPFKQHGKSLSRDGGEEALVATDLADKDAARRIELAALFGGDAARALGAVHAASGSTPEQLGDALAAAARLGVVGNDPRAGAWHATEAIELLLREPSPYLNVMTKSFDSPELAERLVDAARTRPVTLMTHDLPRGQERDLKRADVRLHVIDEAKAERAETALHGTLIDTGDRALVTSAYLEDRVLRGSDGRQSRELGVVLDGAAAAQARAAWEHLVAAHR